MLTAFIERSDKTISTATDAASLSAALHDPNAVFWVDMTAPTDEELSLLDDVFGFHPLAIEDTIGHVQRPKIESYKHIGDSCKQGYFYMVIQGVDLDNFRDRVRTKELDMFVSEHYIVTIHDEPHRSVSAVIARGKADPRVLLDEGIDMLLHSMLDKLVDNYQPILDHLQEEIDVLEENAVEAPEPDLLPKIAARKRDLLNLRRVIGPQRDMLAQLTRGEVPFIRESTRIYLRDVLDNLTRTVELIELYRDLVSGARDIYLSSISNNLNRIMKTLTIITVVTLPLNVVTGFFGMNLDIPHLHDKSVFWVAVLTMTAGVASMLVLFRRKRWL